MFESWKHIAVISDHNFPTAVVRVCPLRPIFAAAGNTIEAILEQSAQVPNTKPRWCQILIEIAEYRPRHSVVLAVASGIHTASGQLSAFGAVCYVSVIAISVPDVRINKQVARWSIENPPGDWAAARARWIRFHVVRTLFSVPAFALYTAAMVFRTT
jgi:hypothetical protein